MLLLPFAFGLLAVAGCFIFRQFLDALTAEIAGPQGVLEETPDALRPRHAIAERAEMEDYFIVAHCSHFLATLARRMTKTDTTSNSTGFVGFVSCTGGDCVMRSPDAGGTSS